MGESPDCPDSVNVCISIEISEEDVKCNEVDFEVIEQDSPGTLKFLSNVEDEEAAYSWFVNDVFVGDSETFLIFNFADTVGEPAAAGAGEYIVCLEVESPNCNEIRTYCDEIVVEIESNCPKLGIEVEPVNDFTYIFYADFEGRDTTDYTWYINDIKVDEEDPADHEIFWQFGYGEHTVCIVNETTGCEEDEFCKKISIPFSSDCPDLAFTSSALSNTEYRFTADFEEIATLEYYAWLINDQVIEEEGTINNGDNVLDYTFSEAGTYDVCIITETPQCPLSARFCKTITVN